MGQVKFIEELVPLGASNRTGKIIQPTHITIHECSLGVNVQPAYKNVLHYVRMVMEPPNGFEFVSYHYIVSDNVIVRLIPDNECAYHAKGGNLKSIGIERTVNEGTDFDKAISNQAQLAATLMFKLQIPLENVVPHRFWLGKECPARLLAGLYGGWDGFIAKVERFYNLQQFIEELL